MAVPVIYGSTLFNMANDLLAGYSNAVDSRALLTYINLAKDEIWSVTKDLKEQYFQTFSQSTSSTADHYFPVLSTGVREYTLPSDLRSIEYIEVTSPTFQGNKFVYAKMNSPEFRNARVASNELGGPDTNNNTNVFYYTIAGQDQFVMAQYPPAALQLTLWYTRGIPDLEMNSTITEILFPYNKKIAEYAAKYAMIGVQDAGQFAIWAKQWRDSLIYLTQAEGTRNDADPQFVQDFYGDVD